MTFRRSAAIALGAVLALGAWCGPAWGQWYGDHAPADSTDNNIAINGSVTQSVDSHQGEHAAAFGGTSSDYGLVTDDAEIEPDEILFCTKLKRAAASTLEFLFDKNQAWRLLINPSDLARIVVWRESDQAPAAVNGTTALTSTTAWYSLCGSYDGVEIVIWVNGAEEGQAAHAGTLVQNANNLYIGLRHDDLFPFGGVADEVFVWDITGVSDANIGALVGEFHNSGNPVNCDTAFSYGSLLACWDYETPPETDPPAWQGVGGDPDIDAQTGSADGEIDVSWTGADDPESSDPVEYRVCDDDDASGHSDFDQFDNCTAWTTEATWCSGNACAVTLTGFAENEQRDVTVQARDALDNRTAYNAGADYLAQDVPAGATPPAQQGGDLTILELLGVL